MCVLNFNSIMYHCIHVKMVYYQPTLLSIFFFIIYILDSDEHIGFTTIQRCVCLCIHTHIHTHIIVKPIHS